MAWQYRYKGQFISQSRYKALRNLTNLKSHLKRQSSRPKERESTREAEQSLKKQIQQALAADRQSLLDRIGQRAQQLREEAGRAEARAAEAEQWARVGQDVKKLAERKDISFAEAADEYGEDHDIDFRSATDSFWSYGDYDFEGEIDFEMLDLEAEHYE